MKRHPFRELIFRLRTEGGSPGRLAAAVALGAFIGCTPLLGLHLALCVVLARLFGLNRALTYLAAQVSLPVLLPFLLFAELQTGRWLRGEGLLSLRPRDLAGFDLKQGGIDLVVGSVVFGALLAALLGGLTYATLRRRRSDAATQALIETAAHRYLGSSLFDWELVRGKLRYDPVYLALLHGGLLPRSGTLVDLGCGRGILFALLLAARGGEGLPRLIGIERSAKKAAAARRALDGEATIETADLASAPIPPSGCILLLDVLHYLDAAAQEALLRRAGAALEPGGALLLREADAAGGRRFTATLWQERLCAWARGDFSQRFCFRSLAEWTDLLNRLGLSAAAEPMAMGTPYANVLIVARAPAGRPSP